VGPQYGTCFITYCGGWDFKVASEFLENVFMPGVKDWWNAADGKTEVIGEKPVPVPLYSPKLTDGFVWG
jgi:hypothetical protein